MRNNKKGFTLVELLVVIAILAILASVAVVGYTAFIDKANKSAAESEAHPIDTSIEAALMTLDNGEIVKISDTLYVVKTATGYTVKDALAQGETAADDLSANFDATMLARLSIVDSKLVYTNNGYAVDVDSGVGTKVTQ